MINKVQKIREEVEKLKGWNNNVRNSTRHMTLQEEDFNRGKHSSYLEILNFIDSLQEEPVSEELESWDKFSHIDDAIEDYCCYDSHIVFFTESLNGEPLEEADDREQVESAFKAGANWQKEQLMKDAVDACVTDIRIYKEENEVDFTVMYEKGIIPYEIEQEVKVIIIKEE